MKRTIILALITIILLLSACAGPRKVSKDALLRSELAKWESFDSEGVVEISYMGLALRKMFVARKNHGELRIDIFDGGVLGAGAAPMLSFYSGEYVAFKSPLLPLLEVFDLSSMLPTEGLNLFSSADELFAKYGQQIMREQHLEVEGVQISFNKKFQLMEVLDPKSSSRLVAEYSNNGKLQDLELKGPDNLSLHLAFDDISYIEPEISPLPKSTGADLMGNLMQMQDINLKQLLKMFLDKK